MPGLLNIFYSMESVSLIYVAVRIGNNGRIGDKIFN